MRIFLLSTGIAGFVVLSSGRTTTALGQPTSVKPWQRMTARSIERRGSTNWTLRGSVRIVQDTAVITADEVDAQTAPNGHHGIRPPWQRSSHGTRANKHM
jgi:lipopolysaccharide export system protein LptA